MNKERLKKLEVKSAPKIYSKDAYPFTIQHCPNYKGYTPDNLNHEVCAWCGSIKYYH